MSTCFMVNFFIVNDDVVVAHCPSELAAATISCSLVIPRQHYRLTVMVGVGGIRVSAGVSNTVNSSDRAIAAVKEYLSTKLAPKEHAPGTSSDLIGKTFWYQKPPIDSLPCLYKVFRRVGGGTSDVGHGDLLECVEVLKLEQEYQPWQYFISRKVTLYESQLNELFQMQ